MPYCTKCGNQLNGQQDVFCSRCGAPANTAARPAESRPLGVAFNQPIVTVESLRSRGEGIALLIGLGLFGVTLLLVDSLSLGVGIVATLGVLVYALYAQGSLKGSSVAVSTQNFPEVNSLAEEAARRLGIPKPNLFIQHSREINAYALGFVGSSCVVLHSETVHAMQHAPKELQFIIGHEFTHIKCSHILWQTIAAKNPLLGRIPVLNEVMPLFFSWWSRQAEFTADRGGLIACRDLEAAQKALARLVIGAELFDHLNMEEFIKQSYDGDVATKTSEMMSSHPLLAKRIVALADFSRSPLMNMGFQPQAEGQVA
jgi:Zn-dependent protease with chaperone function